MGIRESIEIPFGAFDSELKGWEYTIPEGYEARIEDNKVIIEPKESEDEKIRKVLIHIVKGACSKYGIKYQGEKITEEKLLSYLEKQGSQNLANSEKTCKVEPKFKVGDVVRHKNGSTVTITGIEEEERCYYYKTYDAAATIHSDFGFGEECNWELKKQNPAWSEEDEKMLKEALRMIEKPGSMFKGEILTKKVADWLKSLKERIKGE